MLIPLRTDRTHRRLPLANTLLIALIGGTFVVQTAYPAVEAAMLLRPHEPSLLGFVGSGFLHGGLLHLLGNLLFLYIFGNDLDDALGHVGYLAFFLSGVVAASLAHVLLSDANALGASGGVSAVTGLYLALYPRSRVVLLLFFLVVTTFSLPAVWFIGVYFLIDLAGGLDTLLLGGQSNVARWAHVGGGVFGFLTGGLLVATGLAPDARDNAYALLVRNRNRRRRRGPNTHERALDIVPLSQADPVVQQAQDLKAGIRDALERGDADAASDAYERLLALDERQVLPPREQLAVAEALYRRGRHGPAASAFTRYLARHEKANTPEAAQARLMLGLLYARYLDDPEFARAHLDAAALELDALGDATHADFARAERARLGTRGS